LILTGRFDKHNHLVAVAFSPRAALIFKPAQNHNLRFSYNRAFNTPSTNNLFLDILSASIPSPLPQPYSRTLFSIRGQGVPSRSGLTFRRGDDGRPLMMSQLAPQAGYIPATANAIWPVLRQILIDISAGEIQELLMPTLPQQLETAVRGDLRKLNPATGAFDLISDVADVDPLKPTLTTSFEIGYKSLLANKLLFSADLYHSRIRDFVGPLKVETPNVFVNPQHLAAALQPTAAAITTVLMGQGIPADAAQKQAATIVADLVTAAARLPIGVISPNEVANATEVILTYRNFGDISVNGVDINLNYYVTPAWIAGVNYSLISDDLFGLVDGIGNIALNAPRNKMALSLRHVDARRGIEAQLRGRYVDGFPVESGVYSGEVKNYTVVDLNVDYRFYRQTRLALLAQNILNHRHREITGAPEIGRLLILRLIQSF
jgi:iron complex outermembrane receptor protein